MKKMFVFPMIAAAFSMSMFAACSSDESGDKTPSAPVIENPVDDPAGTPSDDPAKAPEVVPVGETGVAHRAEIPNEFPDNVSTPVEDFASYKYYGAELTGREQFTYGRFEARMKMVSIPGSVSSMFLYYDPSYMLGEEPWNEIDIEVLGTNPGMWQANLITREADDPETKKKHSKMTSETKTGFGFDATADFHIYTMVWTPEYISWEIDGVEVRRDVVGMETRLTHDQVAFMTHEQSLRFNLWSSKSAAWVGEFTGAELADGPQEQLIDFVRVYSYDAESKTFNFEWQDDFDGTELDRTRWSAGNWDMENVKLSVDNVVVEDGYCKMRMTRELVAAE